MRSIKLGANHSTARAACFLLLCTFLAASCGVLPLADGRIAAETLAEISVRETSLAVQRGILTQQVAFLTRNAPTASEASGATITPEALPTVPPTSELRATTTEQTPNDLAADWGEPHDRDTFNDASGIFLASDDGASRAIRVDGRLLIEFDSRGRWTWYWSFIDTGNFYADVLVAQGDACVDDDSAGMLFRGNASRDEGYIFGVRCAGEYFIGITSAPGTGGSICAFRNGAEVDCGFRHWEANDVIISGPGAENRLGVYAEGDHLDFYINGVWIASRDIDRLPAEWRFLRGNIALYLGTAQIGNASAKFDNFRLWYFE
ncbi:MAG: hypothetical protein JXA97_05015 [Anaerolineales bacterium]|nr:hypothetical protein [Anaerolineales bacterium]